MATEECLTKTGTEDNDDERQRRLQQAASAAALWALTL